MERLKAADNNQQIVLDYLKKNASESLREKIASGTKTMAQCWMYICREAKKLAQNGCAAVDDQTVFGWAIHFFEEDSIVPGNIKEAATVKSVKVETTKPQKKVKEKKEQTEVMEQLSFF